jgi:branched-chain amino acid transport system substrate-binding protein
MQHCLISRRRALALAAFTAFPALAADWKWKPTSKTWKLGQSTALSGPLGDLGSAIHHGAKIAFAEANARGGVHGRAIELFTLDDGYETKRSLANVDKFMGDEEMFSLFNCMSTPAIAAMLPQVIKSGIPFFAPFTGAQFARPKDARNVLTVRASYAEEAEQIVRHVATTGIKRIAIAYQNNAFGKEILDGASSAAAAHSITVPTTASVESNGSDMEQAVARIAKEDVSALVVGLAGEPAIRFIRAMRAAKRGLSLYTVSVLGGSGTIKALGADGVGVAISQVVPSPFAQTLPIVREFRAAWTAAGSTLESSHLGLEGYINARAFVAALRRAGASATPKSFVESSWSMGKTDLSGFEINFTEPSRGASRFVELTIIGRDGRLVR